MAKIRLSKGGIIALSISLVVFLIAIGVGGYLLWVVTQQSNLGSTNSSAGSCWRITCPAGQAIGGAGGSTDAECCEDDGCQNLFGGDQSRWSSEARGRCAPTDGTTVTATPTGTGDNVVVVGECNFGSTIGGTYCGPNGDGSCNTTTCYCQVRNNNGPIYWGNQDASFCTPSGNSCNSAADCFGNSCTYPSATFCNINNHQCECVNWSDQCSRSSVCCQSDPYGTPPNCPSPLENCGDSKSHESGNGCTEHKELSATVSCAGCGNPSKIYRWCKPTTTVVQKTCWQTGCTNVGCSDGSSCVNDRCINTSCPTDSDCNCTVEKKTCWQTGCDTVGCSDGSTCQNNRCVNVNCPTDSDCNCTVVTNNPLCNGLTITGGTIQGTSRYVNESDPLSISVTGTDGDARPPRIDICYSLNGQSDAFYATNTGNWVCTQSTLANGSTATSSVGTISGLTFANMRAALIAKNSTLTQTQIDHFGFVVTSNILHL